jgi:hypothetical protein
MHLCINNRAVRILSLVVIVFTFIHEDLKLKQSIMNVQTTTQEAMDCIHERGLDGYWLQDWTYANRTNYPNHGSYSNWHLANQKFTSTPSQPLRLATSFRWVDKKCPVHEVNLEDFCNSCMTLKISQILIMGDSLSIEFTQALQSLLGFPPTGRRATNFNARFKPWIMPCPARTGEEDSCPNQNLNSILCLNLELIYPNPDTNTDTNMSYLNVELTRATWNRPYLKLELLA